MNSWWWCFAAGILAIRRSRSAQQTTASPSDRSWHRCAASSSDQRRSLRSTGPVNPTRTSPGATSSPRASFNTAVRLGTLSPRSTCPMYVEVRPATCARSSCVDPRSARRRAPRGAGPCFRRSRLPWLSARLRSDDCYYGFQRRIATHPFERRGRLVPPRPHGAPHGGSRPAGVLLCALEARVAEANRSVPSTGRSEPRRHRSIARRLDVFRPGRLFPVALHSGEWRS